MSIEILDTYPDEVKDYVNDYNSAFAKKDIMEVDMALNGLVTLIFSPDENIRQYSVIVISKIGQIQYKFLKNVMRVLLHRYKGEDAAKSEIASVALGEIVVGKPAANLISDKELLQKITDEQIERTNRSNIEEQKKQAFLEKAKNVQINLEAIKIVSDIYSIGQFYNKSMVDDKIEEAAHTVRSLIGNLIKWQTNDTSKFSAGLMLLSLIAEESKRPPFFKEIVDYLLGFLKKGRDEEKNAVKDIFIHTYNPMSDLLPEDLVDWARSESMKRKDAREEKQKKEQERRTYIRKMTVTPKLKWDINIQTLTKKYNDAIKTDNNKVLGQLIKPLAKALASNDTRVWKSAGELVGLLLGKNPEYVKNIVSSLLKSYRKPKESEILSFMIEPMTELQFTKPTIIEEIAEAKKQRDLAREEERKKKEEEYKKIEAVTIKFEGDWEKKLVKFSEKLNKLLLGKKLPDAQKMIDDELKGLLQAKKTDIRGQAQDCFLRIAEKYPNLLSNIVNEYLELFNSDNKARFVAVEAFGKIYHAELLDKIVPSANDELKKKIETDYDERRKDIENQLMAEKISHIKIDVQTIPILEWPKDIQKICRAYNDAIMKQNMESVLQQVQKIVNIFMNDKKEVRYNAAIEILGLISKKNIELIAPTINMLLEMVDSDKDDTKFKAIRALGEVCGKRPGWAYMGLEKLGSVVANDGNDQARRKAILELSKIGRSNATMLIEYVPIITNALANDKDKHVRRLAAYTLGGIAEVIPLEAKDAIPALTNALHDEYPLVRRFADKALQLIRAAMRRAGS